MVDGGSSVAIVAARRTPIGTAGHGLAKLTAADLAAATLTAVAQDLRGLGVDDDPDEVVLGNCMGPGGDVARVAALQAGLPVSVPGLTVDRQCGSGLAAVVLAVTMLRNEPGVVLAGGVESASTAPWRFWPPGDGGEPTRYERAPFAPASLGGAGRGGGRGPAPPPPGARPPRRGPAPPPGGGPGGAGRGRPRPRAV